MAKTINTIWDGSTDGDWNTAANWSAGVPTANQGAAIPDQNEVGIDAYDNTAVALSYFEVRDGYAQDVGLVTAGIGAYLQLDLGGSGDKIADLSGSGTSLFYIKNAARINVLKTGAGNGATKTPSLFLTGVDNDFVKIQCGTNQRVGLAWIDGEVFETDELEMSGGVLYIGRGVVAKNGSSLIPVTLNGGNAYSNAGLGTVIVKGGKLFMQEGGLTDLLIESGTVQYDAAGTIVDCEVKPNGFLDLTKTTEAVSFTNPIKVHKNAKVYDPYGRGGNLVFDTIECRLQDVKIQSPFARRYTMSAIP